MVVNVDRGADEPVYAQVARQLRALVAAGRLAPGAPLPPLRNLASDLGVSLNTVARAYRQLEAEGFLVIRDREGAVVAAPALRPEPEDVERLTDELRTALSRLRQAGVSARALSKLATREIESLSTNGNDR